MFPSNRRRLVTSLILVITTIILFILLIVNLDCIIFTEATVNTTTTTTLNASTSILNPSRVTSPPPPPLTDFSSSSSSILSKNQNLIDTTTTSSSTTNITTTTTLPGYLSHQIDNDSSSSRSNNHNDSNSEGRSNDNNNNNNNSSSSNSDKDNENVKNIQHINNKEILITTNNHNHNHINPLGTTLNKINQNRFNITSGGGGGVGNSINGSSSSSTSSSSSIIRSDLANDTNSTTTQDLLLAIATTTSTTTIINNNSIVSDLPTSKVEHQQTGTGTGTETGTETKTKTNMSSSGEVKKLEPCSLPTPDRNNSTANETTTSRYFDIDYAIKTFEDSMADKNAISLHHYLNGFKELMKFFHSLGTIFLFVTSDLETKIGLLQGYRDAEKGGCNEAYLTIQSAIDYETKENLLRDTKRQSGARTILRLHRALEFLSSLMLNLSKLSDSDETAAAARDAYSNTLARHHPWTIRTIASFAMRTLPNKKILVESVLGKEHSGNETEVNGKMLMLANVTENLFNVVDKFYDDNNIKDLP